MTQQDTLPQAPGTEYPFAPIAAEDAAQQFRRIAQDRPMTKVDLQYGGETWIIHRNQAARDMLSDPRFIREPYRTKKRVVNAPYDFPDFLLTTIQFADPPEHTKLRRLVQRAISPKRVKEMRESAVAYANALIDEFIAEDRRPVNLMSAYAQVLPMQMLCNLLGVPLSDREKFERWASSTLAVAGFTEEELAANIGELHEYMRELIDLRRSDPQDDLLSSLANAEGADESLTNEEIITIAMLLIVAGFDNTANFIADGVRALLAHPDQRDLLLSDIERYAPTMVEEILRHAQFAIGKPTGGGGGLVPFVATEDVTIDGQLVKKGEAILFDPSSANHDGIAIPDSDTFDVTRQNNPHLMLSFGLHHCLGAPLARMEMLVGIGELFRRLPTLRIDGDIVVNTSHISQPITSLPVSW